MPAEMAHAAKWDWEMGVDSELELELAGLPVAIGAHLEWSGVWQKVLSPVKDLHDPVCSPGLPNALCAASSSAEFQEEAQHRALECQGVGQEGSSSSKGLHHRQRVRYAMALKSAKRGGEDKSGGNYRELTPDQQRTTLPRLCQLLEVQLKYGGMLRSRTELTNASIKSLKFTCLIWCFSM